jgi:antitoxin VapB
MKMYIQSPYILKKSTVINKTAKLFVNGGSQAVRLPAEFRFDGSDEVYIRRDAVTGDVILSARRTSNTWRDFFELRDRADAPADSDFMNDRPLNEPLKPREFFEDR